MNFASHPSGENIEKAYWLSLQCIAKHALINGEDVIVVCDGDHQVDSCPVSRCPAICYCCRQSVYRAIRL